MNEGIVRRSYHRRKDRRELAGFLHERFGGRRVAQFQSRRKIQPKEAFVGLLGDDADSGREFMRSRTPAGAVVRRN